MFLKKPFAPIIGNHDDYHNQFKLHFNLNSTSFDATKGSTYTYIYGDAQFFALNSELWNNPTYMTNLKNWMIAEVTAHKDIKWRIVYFHRPVYSGAEDEQNDPWCVPAWFNTLAPLFDLFYDIQGDSFYWVDCTLNMNAAGNMFQVDNGSGGGATYTRIQ